MKFKPILFKTVIVRAILEGRKTQTRSIIKFKSLDPAAVGAVHPDGSGKGWIAWQPGKNVTPEDTKVAYPGEVGFKCPHGAVGDVLWVRETWCWPEFLGPEDRGWIYKASDNGEAWEKSDENWKWRPSIFMPKTACRLFLQITKIRVERLSEISEANAIAEGCWLDKSVGPPGYTVYGMPHWFTAKECFENLWVGINGLKSLEANPWVWVLTFKLIDKPEGFA